MPLAGSGPHLITGGATTFIFRRSASFESYRTLFALSSRSKMPNPFQDWANKQSVFSSEAFSRNSADW